MSHRFSFFLTPRSHVGSLNGRKRGKAHAIMCSWHEIKCHFIAFSPRTISLLIFSTLFWLFLFFSFNDLLIDDTPNNAMNASNNSTRPNESSAEDELDDDDDEVDEGKKQNGAADINNKTLLVSLLKQINMLHETNSKIFRNLHETKGKWVMRVVVVIQYSMLLLWVFVQLINLLCRFYCSWNGGFEICTELGIATP